MATPERTRDGEPLKLHVPEQRAQEIRDAAAFFAARRAVASALEDLPDDAQELLARAMVDLDRPLSLGGIDRLARTWRREAKRTGADALHDQLSTLMDAGADDLSALRVLHDAWRAAALEAAERTAASWTASGG